MCVCALNSGFVCCQCSTQVKVYDLYGVCVSASVCVCVQFMLKVNQQCNVSADSVNPHWESGFCTVEKRKKAWEPDCLQQCTFH